MAYDVTLFDGTTHTINGEGTVDDPWLIDCFEGLMKHLYGMNSDTYIYGGYYKFIEIISKEQELAVAGDTAEDIARKKKTIDMNRVASGEARTATGLVANGSYFFLMQAMDVHIDGNGTTIKNLYTEMTVSNSKDIYGSLVYVGSGCSVENLNIENAYVNPASQSGKLSLVKVATASSLIKNCKFSIMTNCPDNYDTYGVFASNATNANGCIQNCSFNIRNISGSLNLLTYNMGSNGLNTFVKNSVFRGYSPYMPTYVNSLYRSYKCGIIRSHSSGNSNGNNLNLINCKFIYETLNKNDDDYLALALVDNGNNGFRMNIKNCVFDIINKKKSTCPITSINFLTYTSSSFINMGTNLYIYDEAGSSNPSQNPNNMVVPVTKAQSTNKDYLLDLLFPIMWEDE